MYTSNNPNSDFDKIKLFVYSIFLLASCINLILPSNLIFLKFNCFKNFLVSILEHRHKSNFLKILLAV